jgi:DNA-binding LacI/PurR family transcriptional regulator
MVKVMPNQRDVAQVAGVSSASVSRFLSNPALVSPEVGERISKAIEATNYKLDYHAQRLKMGRSNHVAVLTPGSGPFYWQIIFHLQKVLTAHGYFLSVMYTRDIDRSLPSNRTYISNVLRNKLLEGVVFFPMVNHLDDQMLEQLDRQHENVVIVDCHPGRHRFHEVLIDNRAAGRRAAREFLDRGHRDFLLVHGIDGLFSAGERLAGFREELAAAGVELGMDRILPGNFNPAETYALARSRLPALPRFTAVFAESDAMAIGFMRAASERGLSCPRDYSLIGFDNNLEFTPFCQPALSSFEQHLDVVGEETGRLMLDLLEERDTGPRSRITEASFIERESLDRPPRF